MVYLNETLHGLKTNHQIGSTRNRGSKLGPLLFLLYVNDLKNAPNVLDPIMFADDSNLFLTHEGISYLFETANLQLERISQWFVSNKLSLIVSKVLIFS